MNENLQVYRSCGEEKGLMSIMVTDENVYEQNAVMREIKYRPLILNNEVMLDLIEEYIVKRGYTLVALEPYDECEKSDAAALVQDIRENRMMIYKLWKYPVETIIRVVFQKAEDILSVWANGRYTYGDEHREVIHSVVLKYFKSNN